jgi:hypothetical protein
MSGVMTDLGEPLDDLRDPGQRPEVRAEPRGPRPGPQRPLDLRQCRRLESGLPSCPPGRSQAPAAVRPPRVIPVMGGHPADVQRPRDRALRLAAREQSGRPKPTRFQRGKIPARLTWSGHASTCDRTYEIR